ncbi:MAG: hypothetical protein B7Z37_00965 [Verrucomicrobia bacterium 12-59-8]|nr:MAG: hypothetical protein B7Z37_00965 [Verrucomicrobia bacterium 12-59-8]
MIPVRFNPQQLAGPLKAEWDQWQLKAEAATLRVINAWEDWRAQGSTGKFAYEWEQGIWSELKEWLLKNIFHGKCAYCETREARSPYHAEHFRPKGRVRFQAVGIALKRRLQGARTQDEDGLEMDHPGYFWLAYHWQNLLPSCNNCNSARGKNDQFPVGGKYVAVTRLNPAEITALRHNQTPSPTRADVYYLHPEDLDLREQHVLLHPYIDDPEQHLVFGEFGIVAARNASPMGEASIQVYDLEAEALRIARQSECEKALAKFIAAFLAANGSIASKSLAAQTAIQDYIDGRLPYSAAVLGYLRLCPLGLNP